MDIPKPNLVESARLQSLEDQMVFAPGWYKGPGWYSWNGRVLLIEEVEGRAVIHHFKTDPRVEMRRLLALPEFKIPKQVDF